jgi:glycosyltransferase involved in cell wall biosynthesis
LTAVSISIVVQSYNFAPYLGEAIRSVLALRGPAPDEIVVIDDASTDDSSAIARAFEDPRLRVIVNERNLGAAETFNRAFAETRGEFVARLDGDDRYRPDFLTHAMCAFGRHPEAVAAYGCIEMIDPTGHVTSTERHDALPAGAHCGDRFVDLLEQNFLSAPTLIARREAWQHALPVPVDMPFFDWYAALRIAESGPIAFTGEVHADYRVHPGGMHAVMLREGWGEAIYRRVLDMFFSEPGHAEAKAARRGRIYATWYRSIGDSYFGVGRRADARRCYSQALRSDPWRFPQVTTARRWAASFLPEETYDRAKRLVGLGAGRVGGAG